jgi:hypothetical protein
MTETRREGTSQKRSTRLILVHGQAQLHLHSAVQVPPNHPFEQCMRVTRRQERAHLRQSKRGTVQFDRARLIPATAAKHTIDAQTQTATESCHPAQARSLVRINRVPGTHELPSTEALTKSVCQQREQRGHRPGRRCLQGRFYKSCVCVIGACNGCAPI